MLGHPPWPKKPLEHHLTSSLLSSSNLLLQTSFCLNPSMSLLFHPRLSTAVPHHSVIRNPKCWSPGSDGCSALHLQPPHFCWNHLSTSAPPAMSFQGTLSPPSYTTAPCPLLLPQREWPSSCISQGSLKPKYRLQLPEMYFKRMKRTKIRSISGKADSFRPRISLLLLCN